MITEKQLQSTLDVLRDNRGQTVDGWKFDLSRIDLTIRKIWQLLNDAAGVMIIDGQVKPLRWYNIMTWWKMANLMYAFIEDIVHIWNEKN